MGSGVIENRCQKNKNLGFLGVLGEEKCSVFFIFFYATDVKKPPPANENGFGLNRDSSKP